MSTEKERRILSKEDSIISGNKLGGLKARDSQIKKLGADAYREQMARIGTLGGRNGHTGGFAANPALARIAGARGGRISKRKRQSSKEVINDN